MEAEGEVAVGEVDGGEPEDEDQVGDEVVLVLLVFVADDVHHGHDGEHAAQQLEEVQHFLGDAPFVLLCAVFIDGE